METKKPVVAVKITPTEEQMPKLTWALRGIIAELSVKTEESKDKPA